VKPAPRCSCCTGSRQFLARNWRRRAFLSPVSHRGYYGDAAAYKLRMNCRKLRHRLCAVLAFGRTAKQQIWEDRWTAQISHTRGKLDDRLRSDGRLPTRYEVPSSDCASCALRRENSDRWMSAEAPWRMRRPTRDRIWRERRHGSVTAPARRHGPRVEARREVSHGEK
jgi:hypothetical protein